MSLSFLPTLVFVAVMLCWFAFGGIFLFRKKPPSPPDQKRAPGSNVGLVLQGLSYAIVWGARRMVLTPIASGNKFVAVTAALVAVVSAVGSVMIIKSAVETLGKEWSVTARLVEGHKLATTGPYARVRHPIYTGMLGMLLATGLAMSSWKSLIVALIVFLIGTMIRIRSEESLLREAFGAEFENYARRVSAIMPGIY